MGCKASTEVGNVGPLGHVCRRKEREEKRTKRGKTCWLQSQNGVDYGGPLGAGTVKQEKRGQAETAGGLGSQSGVDDMGPSGLSTGSRWSTTCHLNTAIRHMVPMRRSI